MRIFLFAAALTAALTTSASANEISVADALKPLPCDEVKYGENAAAAMPSSWLQVPFQGRMTSKENGKIVCTVKPTLSKENGIIVVEEHFLLGQSPALIRHGLRKLDLFLVTGEGDGTFPATEHRLGCHKAGADYICEGEPTSAQMFTLKSVWRGRNLLGVVFVTRIALLDGERNIFRDADLGKNMAIATNDGSLPLNQVVPSDLEKARFESRPDATYPFLTKVITLPAASPIELQFMQKVEGGEPNLRTMRVAPMQINTIWTLTQQFVNQLVKAQ